MEACRPERVNVAVDSEVAMCPLETFRFAPLRWWCGSLPKHTLEPVERAALRLWANPFGNLFLTRHHKAGGNDARHRYPCDDTDPGGLAPITSVRSARG